MSRLADLGHDLQTGARDLDIVYRRKRWFTISVVLVLISLLGLVVRQLNMGVEFNGGSVFEVPATNTSVEHIRDVVSGVGIEEPKVQKLGGDTYRIETTSVTTDEAKKVTDALTKAFNIPPEKITTQVVGPSWGDDVTHKAFTSLIIFLVLLAVYLAMSFAPKMAIAALIALLHDLAITVGIYAVVGFVVSPATVIGLLTILGYSLYDTVVVFDKVRENTKDIEKSNKTTYSAAANLAVNQTLVRSINTTVIALLPVAGLLFVGAGLLGAGTLKDLALVLFVGMAVGAYSSIFLATPLVVALKEREPAMKELTRRVATREAALARSGGKARSGGVAVAEGDPEDAPEADAAVAPADEDSASRTTGERVQPKRGGSRERRTQKRR
jgi:preprotein translocase subunit SecF